MKVQFPSQLDGEHHFKDLCIGIGIILVARFAMASMVLLSRFAYLEAPLSVILFAQNFVAFCVMAAFLFKFRFSSLKMDHFGSLCVRIVAGVAALVILIATSQILSMTGAILLNNSGPLFVPFAALLWKKTPLNHKLWPGILLGFLGLGMILDPKGHLAGTTLLLTEVGWILGVIGGICLAISMVSMRVLRFHKMYPILFYFYLAGTVIFLPFAWIYGNPIGWGTVAILIAMGLLTLVMQWGYLLAFKYGEASHLSPFFYVAVLYGALFDWLFFDVTLSVGRVIGIGLMILGGILIILLGKPSK